MISNNVVIFPKKNIQVKPPDEYPNLNTIQNNVEMMRHYHIQETMSVLVPLIFNQLEIAGFHMDDENLIDLKSGAFIIEGIRSLMCKSYDIYHPFQKVSDAIFVPDDEEEEENVLKITDSINIKLDDDEQVELENVQT